MERLHGSCVRLHGRGVLVLGASGSGKSRLCVELIERGGWLIADDAVEVVRQGERLVARGPAAIAGQVEIRWLGLAVLPRLAATALDLVVRLDGSVTIERLPAPASSGILGIELPLVHIAPHETVRAGSSVSAAMAGLVREVP